MAEVSLDKKQHLIDMVKKSKSKPKIFIAHGHNKRRRESLAKIIRDNGFEPIILSEQAYTGKSLIKKLEKNTENAVYAFIMYTDCDKMYNAKGDSLKPRARQNVVFEHGYLIAKLTEEKVAILYKEGVDIPTDISGVEYIELDRSGKKCKKDVEKILKSINPEPKRGDAFKKAMQMGNKRKELWE